MGRRIERPAGARTEVNNMTVADTVTEAPSGEVSETLTAASAETGGISAAFAAASAEMIERVRPSVVQVHSEGRGGGAGVIWRSDGAIVTNNHVVEHAGGTIQVVLTDGRSLEAKVVKTARSLDLALLQVEAQDLPAAPVADSSNLRVGELVFAVGHPWGQKHVVTAGIVAAHGTVDPPGSGRSAHYVRTDARLAPGNSGGPLVDAHGAVVGINAMIFGGDQGVAIPSHVVASWLAAEPSRRVYLGVEVRPIELPPSPRDERRRPRAAGLLVGTVHADGPANRAGLLAGDVLLEVDGQRLDGTDTLIETLSQVHPRDTVRLHVLRRDTVLAIDVEVAEPIQNS